MVFSSSIGRTVVEEQLLWFAVRDEGGARAVAAIS
jgi:hypothetical protein